MCNTNTQRIQRGKERCSRFSLSSKTNVASDRKPLVSLSLFSKHGVTLQHFNVQHQHSTDPERKGALLALLAQLKNQCERQKAPCLLVPVQQTRRPTSALQCATPTLNGSREKRTAARSPRSAQNPTRRTTESRLSVPTSSANTSSFLCHAATSRTHPAPHQHRQRLLLELFCPPRTASAKTCSRQETAQNLFIPLILTPQQGSRDMRKPRLPPPALPF